MATDIELHNAPTVVADDEKAVQHVKGERWYREEIHRGNGFAMIAQKGQPALDGFRTPGRPFHPAGDGGFRDLEAEHQEFAMDARRTPMGILCDHLKDQLTDLSGDSRPTADSISHLAEHGPIQFESGPVPPNHGFWQDDQERLLALRPAASRQHPKITYQVAPVLAGDVCVSRRQVVAGARGFPASGCGDR